MAGLSGGNDRLVVRGSTESRSFTVFYLKDGHMLAADTVNRPQEFMLAKRLIAERVPVNPTQLADEAVPLKSLLFGAGQT